MMLFWKIRYLDRADRQFKDRYLYLDTKSLDPISRAAVELVAESTSFRAKREILEYKHLFAEGTLEEVPGNPNDWDKFICVGPSEYLEDETGKEITEDEMAQILTGSPTARAIPRGAKKHHIDFMLSERKPMPVAEVSLSSGDTRILGYFVRDLQEIQNSSFMKDRPATLSSSDGPMLSPGSTPTVETPASDDEIRSFVTIFRRLFMEKEPANFQKAAAVFVKATGDHPYAKLVEGTAEEYGRQLRAIPEALPFIQPGTCTFTTKRLIEVFLYTQYAHQPDERRQRQFRECLAEVHGKQAVLTWLFLTEMWKCCLEVGSAGKIISWWFKVYCDHHAVSPDVLNSLRDDHKGLGAAEKEEARRKRLFHEKVEHLAGELWEQAGRPAGGPTQFLIAAREQLSRRVQG